MGGVEAQGARVETPGPDGEQGFMLLGLIVAIAIILLMLGVAASDAAFSLRREKEVESARRADQYVRAIAQFYRKNNHYPGSIEQLENSNNIRYLRKKYVDPLTGDEYRMIVVGKNKTTVKGFFGQELGGMTTTAPGALSGAQPTGDKTKAPVDGTAPPVDGGKAVGKDPSSTSTSAGDLGLAAAAGPIMGVGSNASGPSILTVNGQTSYETWEFLYDPRLEQLKTAAAMNGGSAGHSVENDNTPQAKPL